MDQSDVDLPSHDPVVAADIRTKRAESGDGKEATEWSRDHVVNTALSAYGAERVCTESLDRPTDRES